MKTKEPRLLLLKSHVAAYTKKDGTFVKEHDDKRKKKAVAVAVRKPHATETENFKLWFGDSKVVDADGKPLVVYHGTKSDFSTFDERKAGTSDDGLAGKGFYFTYNPEEASGYAENDIFGDGGAPNVQPVYVSLKNPLRIEKGALPDGRKVMDVHKQYGAGINAKGGAAIKKIAEDGGYDGVMWVRTDGGVGHVVAFRPEQIKSAIGNNGNFDPKDASLTKAVLVLCR